MKIKENKKCSVSLSFSVIIIIKINPRWLWDLKIFYIRKKASAHISIINDRFKSIILDRFLYLHTLQWIRKVERFGILYVLERTVYRIPVWKEKEGEGERREMKRCTILCAYWSSWCLFQYTHNNFSNQFSSSVTRIRWGSVENLYHVEKVIFCEVISNLGIWK